MGLLGFLMAFVFSMGFAEYAIPEHCQIEDRFRNPVQTSADGGLSGVVNRFRAKSGEYAASRLTEAYSGRSQLEMSMIENNPSFAIPYAMASLWAPILSVKMCEENYVDLEVTGAMNHLLVSAFMGASLGQATGCQLVMAHEAMAGNAQMGGWMDVRNNVVGNTIGARNKKIFNDCLEVLTQVTNFARSQNVPLTRDHVEPFRHIEGQHDGFHVLQLTMRLGINPVGVKARDLPSDLMACDRMMNFFKDNVVPQATFTETSQCATRLNTHPTSPSVYDAESGANREYIERLAQGGGRIGAER